MAVKYRKENLNKQRHLQLISEAKARRRQDPVLERGKPYIREKPLILIVCEGQNTEPSYFNQFKLTSATIKALGKGYNTVSLIKQARQLKKQGEYDQIWVVFDKDRNSAQNFNTAVRMAEESKFGIAYSNQAFEFWLILHFLDHPGGQLDRSEYNNLINSHTQPLGVTYKGKRGKIITPDFFSLLMGTDPVTNEKRHILAIRRAKRIYSNYDHRSPAIEESSTTVFRLVTELLKYI